MAELVVLSWNLFHGRDHPPEPELRTWRSRLLGITERGECHAQVNRDLYPQFAAVLAEAGWDVALLQECPPRWAERLATDCRAEPHLVLSSRNLPFASAQHLAARLNPDLIASWEGGSNLTLVRSSRADSPAITERRMLQLTSRPERRVMAFTRLRRGVCVANLHASAPQPMAEMELPRAAAAAVDWAGADPLVLGGDFNIRPERSAFVFDQLERDYGLQPRIAGNVIDQLLARGLDAVDPPGRWEAVRREVPDPTAPEGTAPLPIRLSDHSPVQATFALADPQASAR